MTTKHIYKLFIIAIVFLLTDKVKLNLFELVFIFTLIFILTIKYRKKINIEFILNITVFILILANIYFMNYKQENIEVLEENHNQTSFKIIEKINLRAYRSSYKVIDLNDRFKRYGILNINTCLNLKSGDIIIGKCKKEVPNRNTNPKLFNYNYYLLSKNIYYTCNIDKEDIVKYYQTQIIDTRDEFKFIVDKCFKNYYNTNNRNLIKSIILGNKNYMMKNNYSEYKDIGLAHILAVSGLHINILCFVTMKILEILKVSDIYKKIITLIVVWNYAYLIYFPIPIIRSCIMFTLNTIGFILENNLNRRDISKRISKNVFNYTFFICLAFNPYYIYNLAFILSFAVSFILIYLSKYVKYFIRKKLKIVDHFKLHNIVAIKIFILPLEARYFNEINLFSILPNLIFVPLLSFSILVSFILLILFVLNVKLNFLGSMNNIILIFINKLISLISRKNKLKFKVISPEVSLIFMYYIFILLYINIISIRFDRNIRKLLLVYLIFLLFINSIAYILDDTLTVYFIDVNQGDSILLKYKGKKYMIDTGGESFGGYSIGKKVLVPYLMKKGIGKIDKIFISHFHKDHYYALYDILDYIEVNYLYIPYIPKDMNIIKKAMRENLDINLVRKGNSINIDENLSFNILMPENNYFDDNENNKSMVIELSYKDKTLLFTGDLEIEGEKKLLEFYRNNIDVLKVGHHGSNTSTSHDLLKSFKPRLAIISVGQNNSFNHPSQEVLGRLSFYNIPYYMTKNCGRIKLKINKGIDLDYILKDRLTLTKYFIVYKKKLITYIIYFLLLYKMIDFYQIGEDELVL